MVNEKKTEEVITEEVKNEGTGAVTQTEEKKEEEKTLTQKEVDEIVKERLEREKKKLPSKEELAKYNEWKESQKTEAEKQNEAMKELETLKQEKINTERENILLKKGINVDDVDYVIYKVSKLEGDFADNLEQFLKDNPKYLAQQSNVSQKATGVAVKGETSEKTSGVISILKEKHPDIEF